MWLTPSLALPHKGEQQSEALFTVPRNAST
jgi:hypothetical protein